MNPTLSLISRISTPSKHLGEPGPNRIELPGMLAVAVHVPDHGRLQPWRFVLIEGSARDRLGAVLYQRVLQTLPDASAPRLQKERSRFSFAPCIVAVVIKTVQFGWPVGMPVVRKMEADLWEVRSDFPGGIAGVLFTVVDSTMVLLHGFVKKSDSTPKNDLALVRSRMKELMK